MEKVVDILPTERNKILSRFADKFEVAHYLNRKIVSFQSNKSEPIYRWFKYKEGFSSALVKYFLSEYATKPGRILDPFAGIGTTLFAAQENGWKADGIELLPVGTFVIQSREAMNNIDPVRVKHKLKDIWKEIEKKDIYEQFIKHISITKYAYPDDTEIYLNKYLSLCESIRDQDLRTVLKFAAFAILEGISYTRKDGQYLRWDSRSKRELSGRPFDKGVILTFKEAVEKKVHEIIEDLTLGKEATLFDNPNKNKSDVFPVNIISGSSLEELPKIDNNLYDFIVTSPPYCNRYDYTRTYALELIFLGYSSEQVRKLRQSMVTCTVENKEKYEFLKNIYETLGKQHSFDTIVEVYSNNPAMAEVNNVLNILNKSGKLNNSNIPRMVKNYFFEMCFVVYEMARVLKSGGYCVMVNDNVRYGGEEIPVDLILSDFAESFGFNVNKIFVLPKGKGNSSQQMGSYGRSEVRKCVYLWQKD